MKKSLMILALSFAAPVLAASAAPRSAPVHKTPAPHIAGHPGTVGGPAKHRGAIGGPPPHA